MTAGTIVPRAAGPPSHGPRRPAADPRDMASRRPRPRRLLLPIVLAAVLAAEITGLAIARSLVAGRAGRLRLARRSAAAGHARAGGRAAADDVDRRAARRGRDAVDPAATRAPARPSPDPRPGARPRAPGAAAAGPAESTARRGRAARHGASARRRDATTAGTTSGSRPSGSTAPSSRSPARGARPPDAGCLPLGLRRPQQRLPAGPRLEHVQAAPRRLRRRPAAEGHEGRATRTAAGTSTPTRHLVAGRRADDRGVVGLGRRRAGRA